MDNTDRVSTDLKEKVEAQYLEDAELSPEALEFQKKEKKLIKKLDIFIAPVMMMLMLISYLDRGNIGFAATQGMSVDLKLKGTQYNVSLNHLSLWWE